MTTIKRRKVTSLLAVAALGVGLGVGAAPSFADVSVKGPTPPAKVQVQAVAPVTPRVLRNGRPACGNVATRSPVRCDTSQLASTK